MQQNLMVLLCNIMLAKIQLILRPVTTRLTSLEVVLLQKNFNDIN